MALEVLLLCLRMLYFCMAYEHFGALLRMVLIVIKVRATVPRTHVHVLRTQMAGFVQLPYMCLSKSRTHISSKLVEVT